MSSQAPHQSPLLSVQTGFDPFVEPWGDVLFVVVDLETTGNSPADSAITEIGAVKVRGGKVLEEFQTLVNPGRSIPPSISALTGITDSMVASAPTATEALPVFLEFARGAVLVAHNAPFDLGFLSLSCERHGYSWPQFRRVDTAELARHLLELDEVVDCRLSTLADFFKVTTPPRHRALADARATVDVLYGLLDRLDDRGIRSYHELSDFLRRSPKRPGAYTLHPMSRLGARTTCRALLRSAFLWLPRPLRWRVVRFATPNYTIGSVVILRDHDDRLMLLRQSVGREWSLPGGLVKRGEPPVQAAVRELEEETGVSLAPGALTPAQPNALIYPHNQQVDCVFKSTVDSHSLVTSADPVEVLDIRWFDIDRLPALTGPTRQLLRVYGLA